MFFREFALLKTLKEKIVKTKDSNGKTSLNQS